MRIKQYTYAELNEIRLTKGELFNELKQNKSLEFDYALPQEWLESFAEWCQVNDPIITYDLICSTTVWIYAGSNFGQPLSCCIEVNAAIEKYR